MIIAIDGPAASGKGTLGKKLAGHYRLRHLDTGLLYRAVASALLDAGHKPAARARAVAVAKAMNPVEFDETALKRHEVGEAATAAVMFGPAMLVPAPWRAVAIGAAAAFTFTMSAFRVAAGGHFFTDVLFGALTTMLILLAMRRLVWPPSDART